MGAKVGGGQAPRREMRAQAAGVDIGADEIYVAAPAGSAAPAVRRFGTFTCELQALADWLGACGVRTVAMESTSVYWIPLHQILEERGLEVYLVNARHVKNVPGRKSDVSDCQWLQYLHAVGLLGASYRPEAEVRRLRALWRHRESLLQMAAQHSLHLQKALDQMNVQVHHVLSELTGVSGLRILEAMVAGERDPRKLAELCDGRVRASRETMVKALEGNWQPEHWFTLEQSLRGWRYHLGLVAEVDRAIEAQLRELPPDPAAGPAPPPSGKPHGVPRQHHHPNFDLRGLLYRANGVDLTEVPGISAVTAQTLLAEVGPRVHQFRSAAAFASWLGLCPETRSSAGRLYSSRTRPVRNRAALALRLGARSLHHSQTELGEFFRRMRRKLGTPQAITATAHKLARIVYALLATKQPYDATRFAEHDRRAQQRAHAQLRARAARLGFDLVPRTESAPV